MSGEIARYSTTTNEERARRLSVSERFWNEELVEALSGDDATSVDVTKLYCDTFDQHAWLRNDL
jgi:hypothetical protein